MNQKLQSHYAIRRRSTKYDCIVTNDTFQKTAAPVLFTKDELGLSQIHYVCLVIVHNY